MLKEYPDILTPKEAMEILGIGKNFFYKLLKDGEIPAKRIKNDKRNIYCLYVLIDLKRFFIKTYYTAKYLAASNWVFDTHVSRQMSASSHLARGSREQTTVCQTI